MIKAITEELKESYEKNKRIELEERRFQKKAKAFRYLIKLNPNCQELKQEITNTLRDYKSFSAYAY